MTLAIAEIKNLYNSCVLKTQGEI